MGPGSGKWKTNSDKFYCDGERETDGNWAKKCDQERVFKNGDYKSTLL